MPTLSQWMIKMALGYLLLGLLLGLGLLLVKLQWISPVWWRFHPLHLECLQVGWLFHLVLGVAYWIFPRIQRIHRPNHHLAWIGVVGLNLGIVGYSLGTIYVVRILIIFGRCAECLGLGLFVLHLWPRIKAFSENPQFASTPRPHRDDIALNQPRNWDISDLR